MVSFEGFVALNLFSKFDSFPLNGGERASERASESRPSRPVPFPPAETKECQIPSNQKIICPKRQQMIDPNYQLREALSALLAPRFTI